MPLAGKVVPGAIGRLTDLGKQRKGPVRQAFLSFDRGSDCFKHRLQLYYRLYMPRNVMFQCHARAAAAADLMMIMIMMKAGRQAESWAIMTLSLSLSLSQAGSQVRRGDRSQSTAP